MNHLIKINFTGGLVSPGDLAIILQIAQRAGVTDVCFGLRQVLWLEVASTQLALCLSELAQNQIFFELDADECPNIISSYPAQDVFIQRNWLSEGIYNDIFDAFSHKPRLKINIADAAQSFTPMLTGHINWIASEQPHYWYVTIRFPKTNQVYTWHRWVDTSDIAKVSKQLEKIILKQADAFDALDEWVDNPLMYGAALFDQLTTQITLNSIDAASPLVLPMFMLPYYEGFNRYNDKLWLGIYRRNEKFSVEFLQDVCALCLKKRIGLLCITSWKSIIIKNIETSDRLLWDALLAQHQINVRHAANELNFQIEDHSTQALSLKHRLIEHLAQMDTRTFGVCIGIKTSRMSELFCSILIVCRTTRWLGLFRRQVYDVLLAKNFNPNHRTEEVFASGLNQKKLTESLHQVISKYYAAQKINRMDLSEEAKNPKPLKQGKSVAQCPYCLSVYDETVGRPDLGIPSHTAFESLPSIYKCECCETPKSQFISVLQDSLYVG